MLKQAGQAPSRYTASAPLRSRLTLRPPTLFFCVSLSAEDPKLLELRALQQNQFVLACRIDDLERAPASEQERQGLPDLRSAFAAVNAKLLLQQPPTQQHPPQSQLHLQ